MPFPILAAGFHQGSWASMLFALFTSVLWGVMASLAFYHYPPGLPGSAAHSEEDIDKAVKAFAASLDALIAEGIFDRVYKAKLTLVSPQATIFLLPR